MPGRVARVWNYAIQNGFRVSDGTRDATGDKVIKIMGETKINIFGATDVCQTTCVM